MKRNATIALVSALIVIVAGSLATILILSRMPIRWPGLGPVQLYDKTYESTSSQLDELKIDINNRPVHFRTGQASTVQMTWNEAEDEILLIQETGGKLVVKSKENPLWWTRIGLFSGFSLKPLEIYLPENFQGRIDLATTNGPISLEDLNLEAPLSIRTSNGGITAKNLTAKNSILLTTSNGRIRINQVTVPSIHLKTSNGAIDCTSIDGEDVYLETSNGPIRGTIRGRAADFSISSQTKNGDNSLDGLAGQGQKKLSVRTSNGDIDLTFTGETTIEPAANKAESA